jgi:biotin transport system substrate-specific component
MSSETRIPAATAPFAAAKALPWLRATGIVLASSAFVAACAHVAVPLYFTPVPLTLQPFAVLLLGLLLTPRLAGASLIAYLGEGALGLPVFVPAAASVPGIAHLFGPTAGYLLAYPFAAVIISLVYRRLRRGFVSALLSAALGNLIILSTGALWLAMLTHGSGRVILLQSFVPFLPGDALKVVAAASLAAVWLRFRHRNPGSLPTK